MFSVPKHEIIHRSRDELVLSTLFILFRYFSKSERLEYVCVFVKLVLIVYRSSGDTDQRSFWYKRSIRERKVLQGLAYDGH